MFFLTVVETINDFVIHHREQKNSCFSFSLRNKWDWCTLYTIVTIVSYIAWARANDSNATTSKTVKDFQYIDFLIRVHTNKKQQNKPVINRYKNEIISKLEEIIGQLLFCLFVPNALNVQGVGILSSSMMSCLLFG